MGARLRRGVLRSGGFFDDPADALGREPELHQRDAAVETLGVMRDQPAPGEMEPADPLEHDRLSRALGEARTVAEAESCIAGAAVADRLEKIPAIVAAGIVKPL